MPTIRHFIAALGLLSSLALANPDLTAPEAAAAVSAGKVTLIDIRTPPEWKETGVAKGAKLLNMLHPQGKPTTSCGSGAASVNGIRYYSLSGTSVLTNVFDISDPVLG